MARRSAGEGTIAYEAARSRWKGRIRLGDRRISVYGKTKAEVVEKLRQLDRRPLVASATLGDVIDRFLDVEAGRAEDEDLAKGTTDHQRYMLEHFATLRRRPVADLGSDDVRRALVAMARHGLARSTIRRARLELGRVLEWARDEGLATGNAARAAAMPPGIAERRARRALPIAEVERVREAARGRPAEYMIEVGIGLCLRPGELLALRWSDVDFPAESVTIEHSLAEDKTLGPTKTPGSRGTLTARPSVMAALSAQRASQARRRLAAGEEWTDLDLVFPTRSGTPTDDRNLKNQVAAICRRAGVDVVTPNELFRHTGASLLLEQGMSRTAVARQLRHKSTRMLDQHYGHEIGDVIDIGAPDVLAAIGRST